MILVSIKSHQQNIVEICVSGHANYDEIGKDLVCAGVSCIMYGISNTLETLCKDKYSTVVRNDGYFKITTNCNEVITQTIFNTAIIQLETMHNSYAQYIKVRKMEV